MSVSWESLGNQNEVTYIKYLTHTRVSLKCLLLLPPFFPDPNSPGQNLFCRGRTHTLYSRDSQTLVCLSINAELVQMQLPGLIRCRGRIQISSYAFELVPASWGSDSVDQGWGPGNHIFNISSQLILPTRAVSPQIILGEIRLRWNIPVQLFGIILTDYKYLKS